MSFDSAEPDASGVLQIPEHKETRPLPVRSRADHGRGVGELVRSCGHGRLTASAAGFGPFAGCSRYPDCKYIARPARRRPITAVRGACPKCGEGHLMRGERDARARLLWLLTLSQCDFTSVAEPVARCTTRTMARSRVRPRGRASPALCAAIELPDDSGGHQLAGGPPNPDALEPKAAGGAAAGRAAVDARGRRGQGGGLRPRLARGVSGAEALDAFPSASRRATVRHTRRAYRTDNPVPRLPRCSRRRLAPPATALDPRLPRRLANGRC